MAVSDVPGELGRGGDSMGISAGTGVLDGGRETGSVRFEKWDLDQIAWTQRRDYEGRRILRRLADGPGGAVRIEEPGKRHFEVYRCLPFEVLEDHDCNLITAQGWARCLNSGGWLGSAATLFSVSVGRVGLGIGTTAPTYSDTNLTLQTGWTGNNWINNGAAPTYNAATGATPATLVFTCTFSTASYNASLITEFCVDAGTTSGTTVTTSPNGPVNHGVNAGGYGTKTSSTTWNITVTMTFT